MNKSELQSGMIVEYRSGEKRLVIGEVLYSMREGSIRRTNNLRNYNTDMIDKEDRELDIVRVFRKEGSRIYLRSEPTYLELTPHEAMIKLMDDGEFECEVRNSHSDWQVEQLVGVMPDQDGSFLVYVNGCIRTSFSSCRVKI